MVLTILATFLIGLPPLSYAVTLSDSSMKIQQENSEMLHHSSVDILLPQNSDHTFSGQAVNKAELPNVVQKELLQNNPFSKDDIDEMSSLLKTEFQPETADEKIASDANPSKESITTSTSEIELVEPIVTEERFSKEEIDLLARIVRAEAQTEPFEGKVAVACVVLNRLESTKFPDTLKEVIYAPNQFQPVKNGQINKPADEESMKAVQTALSDHDHVAGESLFFYNPDIATSRWLDSRETTVVIGDHVFKK